ncbi:MAG: prepilin-type N-terminal cleavage/methylation domain-containing protein [Phycisphaerales bacterium]|nr:MAG: prepilin-type N-terminal cleavage/methylation domain-containing protein [Phycisphaerales bacterium]
MKSVTVATRRRHRRTGFTLVELVTVTVVIGTVASIAVPRISRGAEGASAAAVKADLAVLRTAIDMYAAEHGGVFPGENPDGQGGTARSENAFLSQMLKFTDFQGRSSDTRTYPFIYGPYVAKAMPAAPIGAYQGSSAVKVVITGPERVSSGNYGWVYNVLNGEIILNTSAEEEEVIQERFDLPKGDIGPAQT